MRVGGILFALTVTAAGAWAQPGDLEIRVRLKHDRTSVELTGYDLRFSPPSTFLEEDPHPGFHRATIRREKAGIWSVRLDHEKKAVFVQSEKLWIRGEDIRVGRRTAPTDLELIPLESRAMDVIARLDLDDYIEGVLPAEMPVAWPLEALKAQAVAARSFALKQMVDRRSKDFDVESTVFDQAYQYVDEDRHPEWAAKIKQAVRETRGEVLLDERRHILKAFYSADCGCQSEDPKFVWGKVAAFQSVKDPTCGQRRPLRWSLSLDRGEVRRRILAALRLPEEASLMSLNIAGRTPSGRVRALVASVDVRGRAETLNLNSQEFRHIFGFQRVRSTDFSMRWNADQLQIDGIGAGHGVGLCQRGAKSMAEQGMDHKEILKLYYPRAHLNGPRQTGPPPSKNTGHQV